ncbi:hypothetical protein R84981_002543 [Carnimonas sp. R-84981]|uniref:hypothetical protein n=1 Tax=Carnimonas bestiolae TaxID=3402172 RepID=UPI003EDC0DBE
MKRVMLGYLDAWLRIIDISLIITFVTQFYPLTQAMLGFIYKPSDSIFILIVGLLWGVLASALLSCFVAFATAIALVVLCVPLNFMMFICRWNSSRHYIAVGIIGGAIISLLAWFLSTYTSLVVPLYLSIIFMPFTSYTYWKTARPDLNDEQYEALQEAKRLSGKKQGKDDGDADAQSEQDAHQQVAQPR